MKTEEKNNSDRNEKGQFVKGNTASPLNRWHNEIIATKMTNYKSFIELALKRFKGHEGAMAFLLDGFIETKRYDLIAPFLLANHNRFEKTTTQEEVINNFNLNSAEKVEQAEAILSKALAEISKLSEES